MSLLKPFTHRGVRYVVERGARPDDTVLKVECILRGPRGRSYGLIRTADHPDLYFAVNAHGFWRSTPFDGFRFRVVDGTLVLADDYD